MSQVGFSVDRAPKRKVVVVNTHPTKDYVEEWKGAVVTVKANKDRSLVMNIIDAEKFLSSVGKQALYETDAAGREINMGKPLRIEELTEEEMESLEPGNQKKAQEKEVKNICTLCGDTLPSTKGLQLHIKRVHPGFEPVKEL